MALRFTLDAWLDAWLAGGMSSASKRPIGRVLDFRLPRLWDRTEGALRARHAPAEATRLLRHKHRDLTIGAHNHLYVSDADVAIFTGWPRIQP